MSLLKETELGWFQRYVCRVLRAGAIPKHVAFIMDGNRRYARNRMLKSVLAGHEMGFEKLAQTLQWCRDLGITEVTVYAFSIENFKRSSTEVEGLMDLARAKFRELIEQKEKITEHQVCFRFIGNLSMLPTDLQQLIAEVALFTKDFKKATLNVCLAYTSQDEMCRAVQDVAKGVQNGLLQPSDVSEHVISVCLDTRLSLDPDLLIRTSGENRLSDFLLWQCSSCCVHFEKVLWPEFSFWNLCYAILQYQRNSPNIMKKDTLSDEQNSRICKFKETVNSNKLEDLETMAQNLVTTQ